MLNWVFPSFYFSLITGRRYKGAEQWHSRADSWPIKRPQSWSKDQSDGCIWTDNQSQDSLVKGSQEGRGSIKWIVFLEIYFLIISMSLFYLVINSLLNWKLSFYERKFTSLAVFWVKLYLSSKGGVGCCKFFFSILLKFTGLMSIMHNSPLL